MTNMGRLAWWERRPDAFARARVGQHRNPAAGGTVQSPALLKSGQRPPKLFEDQWGLMHHHGVEGVDEPTIAAPLQRPQPSNGTRWTN